MIHRLEITALGNGYKIVALSTQKLLASHIKIKSVQIDSAIILIGLQHFPIKSVD